MESEVDFQTVSDNFLNWLQAQQGVVINPKLQLVDLRSRGAGRGVIAGKEIAPEEALFTIPHTLVLTARNSEISKHIGPPLAELDGWLSLVLTLIYELGQGEGSRWHSYLVLLPHINDLLVHWTPTELAELQGSAVVGKIGREEADETIRTKLLPLAREHAQRFGSFAEMLSGDESEAFFMPIARRMAAVMMAYSFDLPPAESDDGNDEDEDEEMIEGDPEKQAKGMVPLADMLNADGIRCNAELWFEDDGLMMSTLEEVEAGEELLNHYGALPRSDLLRRYGYITDQYKRWDVLEISSLELKDVALQQNLLLASIIDQRIQDALSRHIWHESFDIGRGDGAIVHPRGARFDTELMTALHILSATDAELAAHYAIAAHPPDFSLAMATLLYLTLCDRQTHYATSLVDDQDILQRVDLSHRHRQAIEVRMGEKEILASTLTSLNAFLGAARAEMQPESLACGRKADHRQITTTHGTA